MNDYDYIDSIKRDGLRARGKSELVRHLEGGRLIFKEAIYANCYDCMGFFMDGRNDCELLRCPLYPFMIFNRQKGKRSSRRVPETGPAS